MKFALHLRETLVPEWRDQYFDYKLGKKKLKKLVDPPASLRTPRSKQDRWEPPTVTGTAPPTPKTSTLPSTSDNELALGSSENDRSQSQQPSSTEDEINRYLPYSIKPIRSVGGASLALPPPAMEYSSSENSQAGSEVLDRSSDDDGGTTQEMLTQLTDKSPLLLGGRKDSHPKYRAMSDEEPKLRRRLVAKSPKFESNRASRRSILDPVLSNGQPEFIDWVDSQARKIDDFFCEKEKEAIKRFLVLQDQLIQLQMHRSSLKRILSANSSTHSGKDPRLLGKTRFRIWSPTDVAVRLGFSLPLMLRIKLFGGSPSDQQQLGDYSKKSSITVPYTVAKHRLKAALNEYYRSLELLSSFKSLNSIAIRKMMKKFDKQTHCSIASKYMSDARKRFYFMHSEVLSDLLPRTEDLYAYYFEHGSHKNAVEKLRSGDQTPERVGPLLLTGFFLGTALPLFVLAIIKGVEHLEDPNYPDTRYLLQIWGGFLMVNLILLLFTINMWAWTKYKINYPFIFELNPRTCLDYKQFGELPAFTMFLLSFLGWFSLNEFYPDTFPGRYFPPIYLGICVIIFLFPARIFFWRARKWLGIVLWRLLVSGLVPVEFRDFFTGDIMCSLNYSISNSSFFFCLYATYWKGAYAHTSRCSSSHSRLLGFLNTLPGIWRFLQCWRRFGDTADWWPHLANALKYSCLILYYTFLSLARIDRQSTTYHACFILFAAINAVYSSVWDIFMDFSLFQFGSKNFLLRDELAFPSKVPYYAIMIVDPILRFNWIFYVIYWGQIEQSAKISFFVSLVEVFRRFLWVFFRVENEHSANVGRYRASRDVSLPYEKTKRTQQVKSSESLGQDGATSSSHEETVPPSAPVETAESQTQASPRRLLSLFSAATPVIAAVSMAMKRAHTADFERRKKADRLDDDEDDDHDEFEDETTDDDGHNHLRDQAADRSDTHSNSDSIV